MGGLSDLFSKLFPRKPRFYLHMHAYFSQIQKNVGHSVYIKLPNNSGIQIQLIPNLSNSIIWEVFFPISKLNTLSIYMSFHNFLQSKMQSFANTTICYFWVLYFEISSFLNKERSKSILPIARLTGFKCINHHDLKIYSMFLLFRLATKGQLRQFTLK